MELIRGHGFQRMVDGPRPLNHNIRNVSAPGGPFPDLVKRRTGLTPMAIGDPGCKRIRTRHVLTDTRPSHGPDLRSIRGVRVLQHRNRIELLRQLPHRVAPIAARRACPLSVPGALTEQVEVMTSENQHSFSVELQQVRPQRRLHQSSLLYPAYRIRLPRPVNDLPRLRVYHGHQFGPHPTLAYQVHAKREEPCTAVDPSHNATAPYDPFHLFQRRRNQPLEVIVGPPAALPPVTLVLPWKRGSDETAWRNGHVKLCLRPAVLLQGIRQHPPRMSRVVPLLIDPCPAIDDDPRNFCCRHALSAFPGTGFPRAPLVEPHHSTTHMLRSGPPPHPSAQRDVAQCPNAHLGRSPR